jgi:hypothetical protein
VTWLVTIVSYLFVYSGLRLRGLNDCIMIVLLLFDDDLLVCGFSGLCRVIPILVYASNKPQKRLKTDCAPVRFMSPKRDREIISYTYYRNRVLHNPYSRPVHIVNIARLLIGLICFSLLNPAISTPASSMHLGLQTQTQPQCCALQ